MIEDDCDRAEENEHALSWHVPWGRGGLGNVLQVFKYREAKLLKRNTTA